MVRKEPASAGFLLLEKGVRTRHIPQCAALLGVIRPLCARQGVLVLKPTTDGASISLLSSLI